MILERFAFSKELQTSVAAPEAEIPIQNKSAVVLDRSIMHLGYAIYLPNTYTYKHTHVHILKSPRYMTYTSIRLEHICYVHIHISRYLSTDA